MRITSEVRVRAFACASFRRGPAVILALAVAACLLAAGEEETPSADEKTSRIGESGTAQKVDVPAAAPSGFSKTGKKCTATCSTSAASVEAGKLTVSSAGSQLSFEYLGISWGGEPATIGKPETTVSEKIASTSRGGGVVETVTSRAEGFENDLVFASSGGKGDLEIKGTITTTLAIERTFPCDPAAGEFQTDGEVTFLDAAGNRPLQVNPISVKDAAGKSMVATVEFSTTKTGYDFKFKIPETWISAAAFPVTVDPLIGSPAALNTESSGKDYTNARGAFGAGKYFAAYERTDGASADVYARMINADGTLQGAQFSVATGSSHQRNPKVAYSAASGGVFGVVFMDGNNCILKRYDTSGVLLATHTINNVSTSGLGGVGITTNSNGDFLCTFVVSMSWPQSSLGLWGEVRSASGSVVYDDVQLVQDTGGGGQGGSFSNPEPIWNSSRSEWFVLWLQGQALHGKGWNTAMTSGATSDVTLTNWAEWPRIAWNSVDDQYLAVYAYGNVCYGQRVSPDDGSLVGSAFQLNTTPGVDKKQPTVSFSAAARRFVTSYTKGYSPVGGIYGQVVTASGTLWKDLFTVDDGSGYLENSSCLVANPTNDEFLALWADKAWNNTFSVIYYVRLEITPPAVPTVSITHSTSAPWTMTLSWAKDSAADLFGYNVYRATTAGGPYSAPVFVPPPGGATVTYVDSTVSTDVRYYYVVESVDTRANVSDLSVEVSDIIDTTTPAAPTGLAGTAADRSVVLTWTANSESDLAGYNAFYRETGSGTWTQANGTLIPATPTPSYTVTGLVNGVSYDFSVSAKDIAGNESAKSTAITVTPADGVPPAAPTGLAGTSADGSVDLTWNANSEGDLAGYNVYCRETGGDPTWIQKNATLHTTTSFSVTGLVNGTSYDFAIDAKDTSGNLSEKSSPVSVTPADAVPPAAPTGLAGTAGNTVVDLTWTPNSEGDLAGYNVYCRVAGDTEWTRKNGALVGSPSYSVTGLVNWLSYDFAVTAKDTSGNESAMSASITKAPDGPISPPSLDASNERKTNDSTPAITGISTRGWTVTLYQGTLGIGSGLVDATGHFNISTDELSEGSHIIQAKATPPSPGAPTSGLSSGRVVTIDVTAPATPTGLSVLFGDSFADLRWDANTEEDLLGYNIYRREPGVSDWARVNDKPVTGTRYLDESVVNGHTYEYRLSAIDDTLDEN